MTMSGLAAEASPATSLSRGRGGGETLVWAKVCVCVFACITLCVRRKIETETERVQESLIQRASVRSPRLSITLDSHGPFTLAVNHGPALPAHRLEAQDKPTAELHPVCPSSTAHSSATMGHSSHFSLREDPVCQSGYNHQMCEWDGSLRPTWVTGELGYRPTGRQGRSYAERPREWGCILVQRPQPWTLDFQKVSVCQFCISFLNLIASGAAIEKQRGAKGRITCRECLQLDMNHWRHRSLLVPQPEQLTQ